MNPKTPQLLILLLALAFHSSNLFAEEKRRAEVEESWQTIWSQDQRIGYSHSTSTEKMVNGTTINVTDSLLSMTFNRFNQKLTIRQSSHVEETADGKLVRFSATTENPPGNKSTTSGMVNGDEIEMTYNVAGRKTEKVVSGMKGILSLSWPERVVQEGKLKKNSPQSFEVFEPQLGNKATITVEYTKDIPAESGGTSYRLVTLKEQFPGGPAITSTIYCNEDWSVEKVSMPLLKMEMRTSTEKEALEPIGDNEFDLAVDTMVRIDGLKNASKLEVITYRISVDSVDPSEIFVVSPTQKIKKVDDNTIELTVAKKTLADLEGNEKLSTSPDESFIKASQFLECDTEVLRTLAGEIETASSPVRTAAKLETFVRRYVTDKNFSTAMATAAEVAENKAGDCTEHAFLLAALLRLKSIPSRVAIGFVYSEHHKAFVGHMWTEAWLQNQWVPLDATLGLGGTSCGHLTIATSSLADDAAPPAAQFLPMIHLLGRTKIEVLHTKE